MPVIKIKLMTDAYIATGLSFNSYLSDDVCYDEYGLPFIPASRLKGALRASAVCLKDWGVDLPIDEIFGSKKDGRGCFSIEDAKISGYQSMVDAIRTNSDKNFVNPQAVIEQFSHIRGVKGKEGQSRFRVLNRSITFEAFFTIADDKKESFEKCVKALKGIGSGKSKGLGEISCQIDWNENRAIPVKDAPAWNDVYDKLYYSVTLETNVINKMPYEISATKHYIDGRMIAGYIAKYLNEDYKALAADGDIHFSNAYLSIDGKRSIPSPRSFKTKKLDAADLRDGLSSGKRPDDDDQLKVMGEVYIVDPKTKELKYVKADTQVDYHHTGKDYEGERLYRTVSLVKGQIFKGFIEGNPTQLKEIYEVMKAHAIDSIGSFTSSGYGKVKIEIDALEKQIQPEPKFVDEFVVLFMSPMILLNEDGLYSSDSKNFIKLLEQRLGGNVKLKSIGQFQNLFNLCSYDYLSKGNRPVVRALDKGSIYRIKTENGEKIDLSKIAHTWFGQSNQIGYGEVIAFEPKDLYYRSIEAIAKDEEILKDASGNDSGEKLISNIAKNYVLGITKQMAIIDAEDMMNIIPLDLLEIQKQMANADVEIAEILKKYFDNLYSEVLFRIQNRKGED